MRGITRIGLDVGGVLTDSLKNDHSDTSFRSDNFLRTSPVPGSLIGVQRLVAYFGRPNIVIISKCGEVIEGKTRLWLPHWGYLDIDAIDPANVYYCRERADKAPIARRLQLTHFVDDRSDALSYMEGDVPHRYLFGPQENPTPAGLIGILTWDDLITHIIGTTRE